MYTHIVIRVTVDVKELFLISIAIELATELIAK